MSESIIRDISLAPEGEQKIDWVSKHSPVLRKIASDYLNDGTLRGLNIAVVIHLEAKTAYLALLLKEAGAIVTASGSNPLSTQDAVAAALVKRGVRVNAIHGVGEQEFDKHLLATLEGGPDIIVDDGAELVTRLFKHRPHLASKVKGASEQTTSGVHKLKAMEAEGILDFPVIAANNAHCKYLFDNRYGTGQSSLGAIIATTNLLMAGKNTVVIGYGRVGRGVAHYMDNFGSNTIVCEVDPIKALEALADGYAVMPLQEAVQLGDIFITTTGNFHVVRREHLEHMKDGTLLANAGHHAHEIDVRALQAMAVSVTLARNNITEYQMPNGRRIHLLAQGALVNIAAADGHPVEIMDLTFSVQALATHYLATSYQKLGKGVLSLPDHVDHEIARMKLESQGVKIDALTSEQLAYLKSWK